MLFCSTTTTMRTSSSMMASNYVFKPTAQAMLTQLATPRLRGGLTRR